MQTKMRHGGELLAGALVFFWATASVAQPTDPKREDFSTQAVKELTALERLQGVEWQLHAHETLQQQLSERLQIAQNTLVELEFGPTAKEPVTAVQVEALRDLCREVADKTAGLRAQRKELLTELGPKPRARAAIPAGVGPPAPSHLEHLRDFGKPNPVPVFVASTKALPFQRHGLPWPVGEGRLASRGQTALASGGVVRITGAEVAARMGAEVLVVANGTALFVGADPSQGNLVIVGHEGEWVSVYSHLQDVAVKQGQFVAARQLLGHLGGERLTFELRRKGEPLDPALWLAPKP